MKGVWSLQRSSYSALLVGTALTAEVAMVATSARRDRTLTMMKVVSNEDLIDG